MICGTDGLAGDKVWWAMPPSAGPIYIPLDLGLRIALPGREREQNYFQKEQRGSQGNHRGEYKGA